MTTEKAYDELTALWAEFETNHEVYTAKGNKAAGARARKALGEIKKLVTPYKQASVEEGK